MPNWNLSKVIGGELLDAGCWMPDARGEVGNGKLPMANDE
jgi:hypothetical protein